MAGQMHNFDRSIVGTYKFPLIDYNGVRVQMEVRATYAVSCPHKAAIVIKHPTLLGDKTYVCAMKSQGDLLAISNGDDYTIPTTANSGLMVRYDIDIHDGEKVAFYVNQWKYYAIMRIICDAGVKPLSQYRITFPFGRNPSILDEIEKCPVPSKLTPPLPVVANDSVAIDGVANDNTTGSSNTTSKSAPKTVKIEFELKRGKCSGVDCWVLPRALRGSYRVKLSHPVDTKNWKVIHKDDASGNLVRKSVSGRHGDPETMYINGEWSYFWIIDATDESLVNVDILGLEFDY